MTEQLIPGALYECVCINNNNYFVYFGSDGNFYSATADHEGIYNQVMPVYNQLRLQDQPINPTFVLTNEMGDCYGCA